MTLPTTDEVAEQLKHVQRMLTPDDGECAVRLQVYQNGAWLVRFGDASYDTDHHGWWGAGAISLTDTTEELRWCAEDLVEQVEEMEAQDG